MRIRDERGQIELWKIMLDHYPHQHGTFIMECRSMLAALVGAIRRADQAEARAEQQRQRLELMAELQQTNVRLVRERNAAVQALVRVESAHSKLHGRCDNPICPLRAALAPTPEPLEAKMTAPKRWSEPLTPDEHGHVVMADGWCNQCEAWHPDAPMSVRHDFPPDPIEGIKALPLGMFVGAHRYDTDDESVLHLWTSDGRSFDMRWPKSRSAPVSEQPKPKENDHA